MNFRIKDLNDNLIRSIASEFNLHPETAAILVSRGITDHESISYFLNPGRHHFIDPFKMKGMRQAVDRILLAKDDDEIVVIYGDYDVDGISATAIMYHTLTELGIRAIPFIPERVTGYGLSRENIDFIMDNYLPGLVITVDCGINGYDEVEYLKDLAVDVIVTDHHELPEKLPDTITVNCKIHSDYGFEFLCGAGVAYKISTALLGDDRSQKYLDLAAIATIADSMPLVSENRDIVYEGIKLIKSGNACMAVKGLMQVSGMREVNSTSIAFMIAPRINAAGRMGDAASALKLMITDSPQLANELCEKLKNYNSARQSECEELYKSARELLVKESYDKKIIVLKSDSWSGGLVGIIASRLVEEFSRPVILFVNNGGKLHGSARSTDTINIFEAISACKESLTDFGGHAQAAGITIEEEAYPRFKAEIEEYFDKNYPSDCFRRKKEADLLITNKFTVDLYKELKRLEPFGTANKRPVFAVDVKNCLVAPLKSGSPHLSIKTDYIDLLYFGAALLEQKISLPFEKHIIFEPTLSCYNNQESLKGTVKELEFIVSPTPGVQLYAFRESLLTASGKKSDSVIYTDLSGTISAVNEALSCDYGTIFAVYNIKNLLKYESLLSLDRYLNYCGNRNLVNCVVIAPTVPPIKGFRRVIYLDNPLGEVNSYSDPVDIIVNKGVSAFDYAKLTTDKQVFAEIYRRLSGYNRAPANNSVDFARNCNIGFDRLQTVFALEVFIELGFFCFYRGELHKRENSEKHSLTNSKIYSAVLNTLH